MLLLSELLLMQETECPQQTQGISNSQTTLSVLGKATCIVFENLGFGKQFPPKIS